MNEEKSDQKSTTNQVEKTAQCEPGCNCGKTSLGTKGKTIICLVVVIAATAVLARSLARKAVAGTAQTQTAFAATAQAFPSPASTAAIENKLSWGEPLKDMASLNQVAAQTTAIYMYLYEKGRGADEAVKRQIEQAAGKAQIGGLKMALYTLDTASQDYAQITSQVPAPCVLAMVKGAGISVVNGEITEGKLLQAIVAASRPSGCGAGGCGPSGCK